ncbi:DUF6691 family protein [Lewinella sp. IMCC34183]|uniref:DUF6691 family protein n=1 Tax=Lewinella sp. IMCC34183 TaxID=2248762 RepID=UPI000E287B72|nr:DUF6691 family protein [Lewinella sp. IMCC34183]
MKFLVYLLVGTIFGIVMTKSEAVSWFRIQEMFRFESFHMYGIIGVAVVVGALFVSLLKRFDIHAVDGSELRLKPKAHTYKRYILGGILFGFGWAMTGACPGPLFTLLGQGIWTILLVIASAVLGTYVYGLLRPRLPH